MVLIFSAIGIFLWIAVLIVVLTFCGLIWATGKTLSWFLDPADRRSRQKKKLAGSRPPTTTLRAAAPAQIKPPKAPTPPVRPETRASSEIWPKWTPSHRLYKDYELALWQEQFDALNTRK